jgi:predicted esterase
MEKNDGGRVSMTHQHAGQPVVHAGLPIADAKAVIVAIHGRGASAEVILELAKQIGSDDVAYIAPQAKFNTWYPQSFLAPIEQNEPGLSTGLGLIDQIVKQTAQQGIDAEQVVLMGFSQGSCLALEYTARHARRYGGIIGFSGGLVGPPGSPRNYVGNLEGTPIFVGCSDADFHIPLERVRETSKVLGAMGAQVDERIYPGMGHTVNQDELTAARQLVQNLVLKS